MQWNDVFGLRMLLPSQENIHMFCVGKRREYEKTSSEMRKDSRRAIAIPSLNKSISSISLIKFRNEYWRKCSLRNLVYTNINSTRALSFNCMLCNCMLCKPETIAGVGQPVAPALDRRSPQSTRKDAPPTLSTVRISRMWPTRPWCAPHPKYPNCSAIRLRMRSACVKAYYRPSGTQNTF